MIDFKNPEYITLILSLLGGIGTFFSLIWVKVVVPVIKLMNGQELVGKAINDIKKELTTNGGNSLKDAVIDLRTTCHRMETRQKIIEQRTKAALHYSLVSLFETDSRGRITWSNENFCKLTSNKLQHAEGFDWVLYIDEDEREEFLTEFKSCLEMNRKFMRISKNCDGKLVQMVGYPYKINDHEHGGFLVSVSELKEV
jgi:PAS domain S-box-containing protein